MKKIITIGFLAFTAGFGSYLFIRKQKIEKIVDALTFSIVDINQFNIQGGQLKVTLYLKAHNNTAENLNLSTGGLKLDTLRVFEKDSKKQLAESNLNLTGIELPAHGFYELPAVKLSIPFLTGAMMALNQLTSNKESFAERLFFELDVRLLNFKKTITIN